MRYRKRPIEVEAIQPHCLAMKDWPQWAADALDEGRLAFDPSGAIRVKTPDSFGYARIGDWVILGAKGDLYPCMAEIFAETYDAIG